MPTWELGDRRVGDGQPCFLIAEAGVNHDGDPERALAMVDAAAAAGVDAVKFQTFMVDELIVDGVDKAPYQALAADDAESQTEMLARLAIDEECHRALMARCRERGVIFLSTPYGARSLRLLLDLDVAALKVASTDTTNHLLLEAIGAAGRPVILSTGMCDAGQIARAVRVVRGAGCHRLAVLHCTSSYPTADADVHLRGIATLARLAECVTGFSDHTPGVGASPYAVAAGAAMVEKHFTLDPTAPGPDHAASLDPDALRAWVREIRRVEGLLGAGDLEPAPVERTNARALQKCLVARAPITAGSALTRVNVTAKRTGGVGMTADRVHQVLGRRVRRDMAADTPIRAADLAP